jgi:hypothetical protein
MNEPSRAIVPIDSSPIASPSVVGAVDGRVLSALACVDNRRRGSLFIARVLNSSTYPVFCSVYGENSRGISALHPYEFRVDAGGTEDAQIVVPRRAFRPYTRVIVSMRGAGLDYRIDARVPTWSPPARVRWTAAALLVAAAVFAARLGSVSVGDVPARVQTGTVVRFPYDAFGIGSTHYTIDRNGVAVSNGDLAGGSGSFQIASGERGGTLAATVTLSQLGITRTSRSRTVTVVTPAPPPAIERFSVDATDARSGDRIDVRYAVQADRANVSLLDPHETLVENVPLSGSGHAVLTAPAVTAASTFTLRLEAERAGARTASELQLAIAPQPTPSPAASAALQALGAPLAADQLVAIDKPAVAGSMLFVRVRNGASAMTLTLQDPSGRAVSTARVDAGQRSAELAVPRIAHDQTFLLVVTLQTGQGEQSLLMPVPVRAP